MGAAIAPALVFATHKWEEGAVRDANDLRGLWRIVSEGLGDTREAA